MTRIPSAIAIRPSRRRARTSVRAGRQERVALRRSVGEDVHRGEAGEIEPRPLRQIGEGGARQPVAPLAREHRVELLAQRVQMQHVGGGVGELRVAERLRAPVGRLLLLGDLDAEQLARQILEAVPVGVGARQLGGDLGAIDRRRPSRRRRGRASRCRSGRNGTASARSDRRAASRDRARASAPAPICTRSAMPSPRESCTRHSRSRPTSRPSVSVSMATTGPRLRSAGRSPAWRRIVMALGAPPPDSSPLSRNALICFMFLARAPFRMISRRVLERQANRGERQILASQGHFEHCVGRRLRRDAAAS